MDFANQLLRLFRPTTKPKTNVATKAKPAKPILSPSLDVSCVIREADGAVIVAVGGEVGTGLGTSMDGHGGQVGTAVTTMVGGQVGRGVLVGKGVAVAVGVLVGIGVAVGVFVGRLVGVGGGAMITRLASSR